MTTESHLDGKSLPAPKPDEILATEKTGPDDFDGVWKAISDRFFPQLVRFANPEAYADIDWKCGYESLDKDLKKILPRAKASNRWADKMMKVYRRRDANPDEGFTGVESRLVHMHVEFQNQRDRELPLRMFTTSYRGFELHQCPVSSLVIFGEAVSDREGSGPETSFGWSFWGTRMGLEFPVVKLWEYNQPERWAELEARAETDPFALLVMAYLKTKQTQNKASQRYDWKHRLLRRLFRSRFERQDIEDLLKYVDWMMQLPEPFEDRLDKEVEKMQETQEVPYVTSWERRALKKGKAEGKAEGLKKGKAKGLKKGKTKGLKKGKAEGLREGKAELLKSLASHRFGELDEAVTLRFDQADVDTLDRWSHRLLDARSLEEVFETSG